MSLFIFGLFSYICWFITTFPNALHIYTLYLIWVILEDLQTENFIQFTRIGRSCFAARVSALLIYYFLYITHPIPTVSLYYPIQSLNTQIHFRPNLTANIVQILVLILNVVILSQSASILILTVVIWLHYSKLRFH